MDKKQKILELRRRLDRTLALPGLTNDGLLKSVVKNQLLLSSLSCSEGEMEQIVAKRTTEVSNFLEMLRSASENQRTDRSYEASHIDWKIKQDTDQLRVMYREGPDGSPFHNLLTEGYADGPIDVCLCISWESTLYHKWWPQFKLPTFKILMNTCLQKVRIGEEISLLRVKVPWPMSDREVLLHYFEIEYLEEDLVLVLLNTISDTKHVDVTDGFTMNEIPEAKDATRIDLIGGFVLQKVDQNRSYFRAIFSMDIKLDFVHPSLINFITRQLIGSGYKLYNEAIGSVATSDKDYQKALEGPMYARIREGIRYEKKTETDAVSLNKKSPAVLPPEKQVDEKITTAAATFVSEITEEEMDQSEDQKSDQLNDKLSTYPSANQHNPIQEITYISPDVEHALDILDSCITLLRGYRFPDNHMDGLPVNQELPPAEAISEAGFVLNEDAHGLRSHIDKTIKTSEAKSPADYSRDSMTSSGTSSEVRSTALGPEAVDSRSGASHDRPARTTVAIKPLMLESTNKVSDEGSLGGDGFHKKGPYTGNTKGRWKKWIYCLNPCVARS